MTALPEDALAVKRLAALAHETRLAVFRALVSAGPAGLAAGALASAVGVSPSNLSAHLSVLSAAGLTAMRREGRNRIHAVELEAVGGLVDFLVSDCCGGQPEVCRPVLATMPEC